MQIIDFTIVNKNRLISELLIAVNITNVQSTNFSKHTQGYLKEKILSETK